MDIEKLRQSYENARRICRIVSRSFFAFFLPTLLSFLLCRIGGGSPDFNIAFDRFLSGNLPFSVGLFILLASFYSAMRLTVLFDSPLRDRYLAAGADRTLSRDLAIILTNRRMWAELAVYALLFLLLPLQFCGCSLTAFLSDGRFDLAAKLTVFAVQIPAVFLVGVLSRLSAFSHWRKCQTEPKVRKRGLDISSERVYTGQILFIGFAYSIGGFGLKMLLPQCIALFPLVITFLTSKIFRWILFFAVAFWGVRYGRALLARHRFLRKLKALCRRDFKAVRYPYRSLFSPRAGENFTVVSNGKEYSCKLLAAPKLLIPLFIGSDGILRFLHTVRIFNITLFTYNKELSYAYEAPCQKILIIQPRPKKVFGTHLGKSWELDNGDFVGDYRIFTAGAFLRALERGVFDKK